jgi:nitroreductase
VILVFKDLVLSNRSYRRFKQNEAIDETVLRELVDLARQTPSASNLQPLRYALVSEPSRNAEVFPTLAWAGYLTDWSGPAEGERPSAYIVILSDKDVSGNCSMDCGIAAQTILLGAAERGLGGCMIGSVAREKLRGILGIGEKYDIVLVVALGIPSENVVLEDVGEDGSIKYYRDANDTHHVPKRKLNDVIV